MGIARFADLFHESRRAGIFLEGLCCFTRTALMDLIFNFVLVNFWGSLRVNSSTIAGRLYAIFRRASYACVGGKGLNL